MIELKCGAGELTGRVAGEPEALLTELTEAVALVLDRIDELFSGWLIKEVEKNL